MQKKNNFNITILKEDAIVIHALLTRFIKEKTINLTDRAEKNAFLSLWDQLDQTLAEPFESNYQEMLEAAREFERLRSIDIEPFENENGSENRSL